MLEEKHDIKSMIYEIRGKQVMLDSDLAKLYQCKNGTKTINLAVKRNIERFPDDFYFQLTEEEFNNLRFQFETTNNNMSRSLPYVFTEQGVAMLSSVLRTSAASKVSIKIMRAFVEMRKYINTNLLEQKYVNNLVFDHENRISLIEELFEEDKNNYIYFKGQRYDAYSLLIDIFKKSKKSIIIVDNYIDKSILDILRSVKREVTIITNKYNNTDYSKYKSEYSNVKLIINNDFHDRFIIIDNKILYHSGSSFKDLGNKCFMISLIDNKNMLDVLLKSLNIK